MEGGEILCQGCEEGKVVLVKHSEMVKKAEVTIEDEEKAVVKFIKETIIDFNYLMKRAYSLSLVIKPTLRAGKTEPIKLKLEVHKKL